MTSTFTVETKHDFNSYGNRIPDARFIVATRRNAETPLEAAVLRFNSLRSHEDGAPGNRSGVMRVTHDVLGTSYFRWDQVTHSVRLVLFEDGVEVTDLPPARPPVRTFHGFKEGELVRLTNADRSMSARLGALAIIDPAQGNPDNHDRFLPVRWIRDARNQSDGNYYPRDFESACPRKQ
jgi:hypothetical protein